jgi:hypothetical protein
VRPFALRGGQSLTAPRQAIVGRRVGEAASHIAGYVKPQCARYVRQLAFTDAAAVLTTPVAVAQLGQRPGVRVNGHIGDRGENPVKVGGSLCATFGRLRAHLPLSVVAKPVTTIDPYLPARVPLGDPCSQSLTLSLVMMTVGRFGALAVGLATAPILARALGPQGRGVTATSLSILTIMSIVTVNGVVHIDRQKAAKSRPVTPERRQVWMDLRRRQGRVNPGCPDDVSIATITGRDALTSKKASSRPPKPFSELKANQNGSTGPKVHSVIFPLATGVRKGGGRQAATCRSCLSLDWGSRSS